MPKLSPEEVATQLNPVASCLKNTVELLKKELLDAEVWEGANVDALLVMTERLVEATSAASEQVTDLYHWLHWRTGTTPGLSRPMALS